MNNIEETTKKIFDSFIIPYTNISIMKGTNPAIYSEENMKKAYERVKLMVEDKLKVRGYSETTSEPAQEVTNKNENSNALILKPEPMLPVKTGGFADVVILTIIVLIYAAIIVNLILKLK